MGKIRVTKEFRFETAHTLLNYDGPCRNIHGHSYKLFVTIIGEPVDDISNSKYGMVIDFSDLKSMVNREVVDRFDHTVVVSSKVEGEKLRAIDKMFGNVLVVDYQPTCENMVEDIAGRVIPHLPEGVTLHSVKLYETTTSYAEWFAGDNI